MNLKKVTMISVTIHARLLVMEHQKYYQEVIKHQGQAVSLSSLYHQLEITATTLNDTVFICIVNGQKLTDNE